MTKLEDREHLESDKSEFHAEENLGEGRLLRTSFLSSVREYFWSRSSSIQSSDDTFGDIKAIEMYARYFIEQRNQTAHITPNLTNQKDYFSDFIEARALGPVALIGAGQMGSALLQSWIGLGLNPNLMIVVEPKPSAELVETTNKNRIRLLTDIRNLGAVSVLFLAIKPQDADAVLPYFSHYIGNNTLIISIMAGKSIGLIARKVQRSSAIVRAMPNIAATIGKGVTAAVGYNLTQQHSDLAHGLLMATGAVEWIEDEHLMDAVTAVSGSGPAYVFLLTEVLARAGTHAGLPVELAKRLARLTVAGSGELLELLDTDVSKLREKVTSKGGTTEAALNILMGTDGFESLMRKAVVAATNRSRQLAE